MYAVGRIGSYISRGVYTVSGPFHPFGGAVDIIVVEQPDGSFKSSPWYVRFGKFQGVLKTKEKVVSISVNGVEANFHMYLDHKGEAYFLKEVDAGEGDSVLYPSSSSDETDGQSNNDRKVMKSKSCNYDDKQLNSPGQIDSSGKKIMSRSGSRRARFLGLVFGRRSMKEDGFREGEGDNGIERLSSLERAEIAANLLEVKWSTNLASGKSRKGNASRFSAPDVVDDKVDKNEEIQVESSLNDDGKGRTDESVPQKEIDSQNEEVASSFLSSSENLQNAVVEASIEISCTDTMEQVETSTFVESVLEENGEILSEISRMSDKVGVGNADQACPDSAKQFNEEEACDEKDVTSPGCRSSEDSGSERVQPFVYCETSESSMVLLDGSNKRTQETLYVASGGCGEVHVVETLHVNSELLSKDTDVEQAMHNELEKALAEVSESHSDKMNSATCRLDCNETDFDESFTVPECCTQVVSVDPALCATEEVVLQNICTTQSVSPDVRDGINIVDNLHQTLDIGDSQKFNGDNGLSKVASNSTLEFLEEEHLLFGDLDEFKCNEVLCMDSTSPDCSNRYNDIEYSVESIKEVYGPVNANDESCSSSDKFVQHNRSTDPENVMGKSRGLSSPISIPMSHIAGEEVERLAESLPNMWSPTGDLSADDFHCPLSHSLDSNSTSLKWALLKENDSSCMKSDVDKEQQLPQERPTIDNSQISEELKIVHSSPTVEISLCKHLLYEGMGANAASEAFDAQKLDIDKFTSLGPAVLKNDRLVVRIDGHYFPWNVAAPFVLGMVAFGINEIFEPKGMIPVDRVEKSIIGDPSKTIASSGGSWLWPFTFRRSRSRKAMQPARSDSKPSDAEVASNSINGGDEAKNVCKPMMAKKMIRAITPTSEELASLNLKEGRNTVTFTFFTPMLGKQQVDARIYLWKWNTRIVISDVDGTITKSDVLGQFMPLVGVDWSQTGVAHLFSAIKENGYQLLFLSARAISQAYHTRQFLFNLKQDGKALPDGPVVISPDGLFPSLFREVIRRAPHEFKISCLEDIRALFPSDCNPFYAGFGNRDTDEFSYLKVGIPRGKIFIINPKGEVAVSRRVDTKSYSSLHALVHGMFPSTTSTEQEDFNTWNYWRLPPPDIDV